MANRHVREGGSSVKKEGGSFRKKECFNCFLSKKAEAEREAHLAKTANGEPFVLNLMHASGLFVSDAIRGTQIANMAVSSPDAPFFVREIKPFLSSDEVEALSALYASAAARAAAARAARLVGLSAKSVAGWEICEPGTIPADRPSSMVFHVFIDAVEGASAPGALCLKAGDFNAPFFGGRGAAVLWAGSNAETVGPGARCMRIWLNG